MTSTKNKKVAGLRRKIDFNQFLNEITTGEPVLLDAKDTPPWFQDGTVYQVSETTFMYHLEVLPPRWIDGDRFAFGEEQAIPTVLETRSDLLRSATNR